MDPKEILNEGLLSGMMVIGGKFKNNEVFVPEVLVAARAMNAGLSILEPRLVEVGNEPVGRAVIGTVQGDLHDIGKNLVCMMFKGAGFEVCDLGVDVSSDAFIDKAEEMHADVIGMSALLSTTMCQMQACIDRLKERGLRDKVHCHDRGRPCDRRVCPADRGGLLHAGRGLRGGDGPKSAGPGKEERVMRYTDFHIQHLKAEEVCRLLDGDKERLLAGDAGRKSWRRCCRRPSKQAGAGGVSGRGGHGRRPL